MELHDLIMHGPFGSVRMDSCNDQAIKDWISYGLKMGATSFESMPSEKIYGEAK